MRLGSLTTNMETLNIISVYRPCLPVGGAFWPYEVPMSDALTAKSFISGREHHCFLRVPNDRKKFCACVI
jgi:hypothetical protein